MMTTTDDGLVLDGPAPEGYRILRNGPRDGSFYGLFVSLPNMTVAQARKTVASGRARFREAYRRFNAEVAAREGRAGKSIPELDPMHPDVHWYNRCLRLVHEIEARFEVLDTLLSLIPVGSILGCYTGKDWEAIRRTLERVETFGWDVGTVRDED